MNVDETWTGISKRLGNLILNILNAKLDFETKKKKIFL